MGSRSDSEPLQSLARFAGRLIEQFAGHTLDDAAMREIAPRLVEALRGSLAIDGAFVALLYRNAPPTVVSQTSWPEPNPRYAEGPYLLDPFTRSSSKGPRAGAFAWASWSPGDSPARNISGAITAISISATRSATCCRWTMRALRTSRWRDR